ncbi:MAG: ABC transporter permease [Gemmatimonadota bacterium]
MVEFGGVEQAKEGSREERGVRPIENVVQDVAYAVRMLRKRPGFTAVAVLTLALGIGATTAIFSVVNGVVLKALPYEDADRIVRLERADRTDPDDEGSAVSPIDLEDWGVAETLRSLAVYSSWDLTLTGLGRAERLSAAVASPGFFEVFRSAPVLGRAFTDTESTLNGPAVAVIGHAFWQSRLGGDPDVLGRTIELDGDPHEIVGVAPPGFDHPEGASVWIPLQNDPSSCGRGCTWMRAAGRLAPGASLEQAREELRAIAARVQQETSGDPDRTVLVNRLQDEVVGSAREALLVLLLAVTMVLLIACVNVANLLLARGATRKPEMAVRAALGAGRRRLAGQMLTESAVLAVAGGAVGVLLAWLGVDALRVLSPGDIPRIDEVALDGWTVLFALGLVIATTFVAGFAPAAQVGRVPLARVLQYGGRSRSGDAGAGRGRSALLVAEVALSVLLLAGAGLLLRSFVTLASVDPGFTTERVAQFGLSLPDAQYPEPDAAVRLYSRLDEELEALPGVASVAYATGSPLGSTSIALGFRHTDRPPPEESGQGSSASVRYVDEDFFETMEIPIVAGRGIQAADLHGARHVVVVNRSAAREFWGDEDPIGTQIELGGNIGGFPEVEPRTVVGIVSDIRSFDLAQAARPELYVPIAQGGPDFTTFLIRTRGESAGVLPAARRVVERLDPDLPMLGAGAIEDAVADDLARPRFMLMLVGLFAVLAVILAVVGIYGVVAYVVSRRTREIGIRMAMGATTGRVLGLVLRQGVRPAAIGVVIGLGLALVGTRTLRGLLYGVEPHDPLTLTGVALLLLAATGAACLLPARRAARIPPAIALREE